METHRPNPLIKKTRSTLLQFIRYLVVGGFAALVDTGTLYLLNARFGMNHLVAAAIGFLLGLLTNYFISIAWVFDSQGNFKQEFTLFALIGLGGLGWTELIMWIGVNLAHAPVMLAKGVALFLVLVWNFGMRKKFVFADPSARGMVASSEPIPLTARVRSPLSDDDSRAA